MAMTSTICTSLMVDVPMPVVAWAFEFSSGAGRVLQRIKVTAETDDVAAGKQLQTSMAMASMKSW